MKFSISLALISFSGLILARAQEMNVNPHLKPTQHQGWIDLITADASSDTGLKHWRNVNVAPSTFKLKKKANGETILVCSGKPTGLIRSANSYENFLVEFDWKHTTMDGMRANAGFFIWSDGLPSVGIPFSRSVEIQVANFDRQTKYFTTHGDIFPIHGASMQPDPRFGAIKGSQRSLPLEFRAKTTNQWNHYRILCIDGTIQLEVNGRLVSGGYHASPRKGHLMLESEGGEVHFKNIRILPLPASKPKISADDEATTLPGTTKITSLYNGLDLQRWDIGKGAHFTPGDYLLLADSGAISTTIKLNKDTANTLIIDWFSTKEQTTLPFKLGHKTHTITPLKPGRHRAFIDLNSLDCLVDGKLQKPLDVTKENQHLLTLGGLGDKGSYRNILQIEGLE